MGRSKRSSDLRALGIGSSSLCFHSVFSGCVFSLVWASLVSHVVSPWGRGCCFGPQELDKIVCRHAKCGYD